MRWPVLVTGGVCLIIGLNLALSLLGVWAPVPALDTDAAIHGQIMTFGFAGTLICLERVVALREKWALIAPISLGIGGLLLLLPDPTAGRILQVFGMALLLVVYGRLAKRGLTIPMSIQTLGAVFGLGALLLWWAGAATWSLIPWIAGYFVFTIVGERVELAFISLPKGAEKLAWGLSLALAFTIVAVLAVGGGGEFVGLLLIGQALWLMRFDIARQTVKTSGLPQFSAANMIAAMFWLMVAGVAWVLGGPLQMSPVYDTVVHSVTIGFTMSMIMAHAPIILPAVIRRPLPYRSYFWIPAVLLNTGLLIRLIGDVRGLGVTWQIGGTILVLTILGFLLGAAGSSAAGPPKPPAKKSPKKAADQAAGKAGSTGATASGGLGLSSGPSLGLSGPGTGRPSAAPTEGDR